MKKPYSLEKRMEIDAKIELDKELAHFNKAKQHILTQIGIIEDRDKVMDIDMLLSFHKKYVRVLDNYLHLIENPR